ncbi:MAG: DUF2608 domain-containing protein [Parachlamydiaceae bacterium]|nr:DUF2608 domain-containing protein [Parachlamydiaceae bacterium]
MKIIILALYVLLSTTISAEIHEIHHFSEFEDAIAPLKSTEWLLFDIDYTLTEPSHPALQMGVIRQNKQRFRDEQAKFTTAQKQLVPVVMITQAASQLTDPSIPMLIQKLQDQNIPILGFTAIDTSVLPQIGSIPAWRFNELKNLGINFNSHSGPFPKESLEFSDLPSFRGTFPIYENGILYCNVSPSKGAVLAAFMDYVALEPSRVILIDDTLENLQSVEEKLAISGIPFLGIHFKIQHDNVNLPKVTDEEWNSVWEKIRQRVELIIPALK